MKTLLTPPALLVLDVQKGFDDPFWGDRNNPQAEENILKLLTEWRKRGWEVIYSQHLSLLPKSPLNYQNRTGVEFKEIIKPLPQEVVFQKNVNSAFIGTELESYLRDKLITSVMITGLSTQHCVSTTTRMSGNLGFETFLVELHTKLPTIMGLHILRRMYISMKLQLYIRSLQQLLIPMRFWRRFSN
jgi:nicotinamidase-related amidase